MTQPEVSHDYATETYIDMHGQEELGQLAMNPALAAGDQEEASPKESNKIPRPINEQFGLFNQLNPRNDNGDQLEVFCEMFAEASQLVFYGKRFTGPTYQIFTPVLAHADELLRKINPHLTPASFFNRAYRPSGEILTYDNLELADKYQLDKLVARRARALATLGHFVALTEVDTEIDAGVLHQPDLRFQGEHQREPHNRNCFNACYRMALDSLVSFVPNEVAVRSAVSKIHYSHVVEDEEYLKTFHTETFKDLSTREVNVISINGATLSTIARIANKLKTKNPHSLIQCIVNLQSEQGADIWHTNVLVSCNRESVFCMDPTKYPGYRQDREANRPRMMSKTKFHRRWAVAFNRAHLLVAQ